MDLTSIIGLIPEKYRPWAYVAGAISPFVTRALYAAYHGKGIKGTIAGIWLGTNTPPAPPAQAPGPAWSPEEMHRRFPQDPAFADATKTMVIPAPKPPTQPTE